MSLLRGQTIFIRREKVLPTMLPKMMPELKLTVLKAIEDYIKGKLELMGSFRTKISSTISVD
ncbi:MAG: hypothetical protein ACFFFH_08460 [Candidatus Thorarchaeota archaeon]